MNMNFFGDLDTYDLPPEVDHTTADEALAALAPSERAAICEALAGLTLDDLGGF